MGKSNDQVIGYKYFTNFLLFIGNPIEKLLGINFDKRGWIDPFTDEDENILDPGVINSPTLYGETEGGVSGAVYLKTGTNDQAAPVFYQQYMESKGLVASGRPFESWLAFQNFYVGNSGYMKEMLLWPKRTRIRNDGRRQWYEVRGDGAIVCEIAAYVPPEFDETPRIDDEFLDAKMTSSFANSPLTIFTHIVPVENNTLVLKFGTGIAGGELPDDIYSYCIQEITSSIAGKVDYWEFSGFIAYAGEVSLSVGYSVISRSQGDGITTDHISGFTDSVNQQIQMSVRGYRESQGRSIHTVSGELILRPKLRSLNDIECMDINPIHKIREILTDDTAMNKPESSVNNDNFIKAADRIYDEGLGVSWSITEKSCIDAINELCYHIEAGIRVNRQTGLYEMVLFRDDWFEEDEIHTIAESKIKSIQYEITNADEVINQVNVNYYDRDNIKNSSFSISENGLIQTLNRVNAETVDFPYFMNMRNAEIVANWKLKQLSTGAFKGSFTTGWREARKWNRYDLIRLPWSKRWIGTILVRIMSINLGGPTNNEVSIEFIEVVPATGMMNTTIVADEPIDKPLPPQACQYEPFEMPYYLAVMALGQRQVEDELAYENNFGLVGVVAERPQSNSLYAVMMTNNYDEWVRAGSIQYSETADLDQNISRTSTSFTVKNWKKIANFPAGTLIQCGKEWLTGFVEWMVFQGVDPYTGVVSVKRGALDTGPQEWDLGLKLYFCGNDVAYDATEYIAGEKVLVSALTTTPSGVLELKGSHSVEMKARAIRPYPPANVKINGAYFPETQIITNDIVLTWAHRNRLQQTGGEILGWYEDDVTAEEGVTYSYELTSNNTVLASASNITSNTTMINASTLILNRAHTLKLWSIRDGYKSYQVFEHSFFVEAASLILTATSDGSRITGNTVPIASITVDVDTSLKANMQFDGSSIKGKATAGSIITIEVEE